MRKYLAAAVGFAAIIMAAAPASAADMAVKAPPPAPLPVIYDWSGFYIGGNGGWGQSRNCWDFLDAAGVAFASGCRERSGGLIGGRSVIAGKPVSGCLAWKLRAIGRISAPARQPVGSSASTRTTTDGIGPLPARSATPERSAVRKGGAAVTSNRFSILDTAAGFEFAQQLDPLGGAS
jgi:outer membrane immunogenic protein